MYWDRLNELLVINIISQIGTDPREEYSTREEYSKRIVDHHLMVRHKLVEGGFVRDMHVKESGSGVQQSLPNG
jgi:hypothetical protein